MKNLDGARVEYELNKVLMITNSQDSVRNQSLPFSQNQRDGLELLIRCFCAEGLCFRSEDSRKYFTCQSKTHSYGLFDSIGEDVVIDGLHFVDKFEDGKLIADIRKIRDKIHLGVEYEGQVYPSQSIVQNKDCHKDKTPLTPDKRIEAVDKVFEIFYGGLGKSVLKDVSYRTKMKR